jgi:hypothetical protein
MQDPPFHSGARYDLQYDDGSGWKDPDNRLPCPLKERSEWIRSAVPLRLNSVTGESCWQQCCREACYWIGRQRSALLAGDHPASDKLVHDG